MRLTSLLAAIFLFFLVGSVSDVSAFFVTSVGGLQTFLSVSRLGCGTAFCLSTAAFSCL